MAAAMDASSDSPSHSISGNENSPQLTSNCRNATVSSSSRSLQSPWSQIVRGEAESSSTKSPRQSCPPMPLSTNNIANRNHGVADSAVPADSDHSTGKSVVEKGKSSGTNDDASLAIKRPAWSKPSSGPTVEVGPVMGAASWPALSESSARSSSLRSSSDSPNTPPLPVTDEPSPSSLQAVLIAMLDNQRVPSQNASANPMPNHSNRHRASNRRTNNSNNNNNTSSNNNNNNNDISNGGASSPMMESPHRVAYGTENAAAHAPQRGSRGGSNMQGQTGNDHPRNSFRRGNSGGSHTRAEGSYHGNYGNRREHQDGRSNSEWNSSSHHGNNQRGGYGARDVHAQQRVGPRSFTRQPPAAPVYMSVPPPPPSPQPAPQRGFHNPPIGYVTDMGVYYLPAMHVPTPGPAPLAESIPAMQFVAPGPPPNMFFPPPEPPLQFMLVTQIEYYFSSENLCRDIYLRTNMDAEGWVPISMIAEFNRVKMLTTNIPFILASLDQRSSLVEVQGHKVRRRNDWKNWLLPPNSPAQDSVSNSNVSGLVNHFQAVGFEESGH